MSLKLDLDWVIVQVQVPSLHQTISTGQPIVGERTVKTSGSYPLNHRRFTIHYSKFGISTLSLLEDHYRTFMLAQCNKVVCERQTCGLS
jgi:hypothetical protein